MLLDITAPIIPFVGFGEIKLYSTKDDLKDLLEMEGVISKIIFNDWIQYDIQNDVELLFQLKNNLIDVFNSSIIEFCKTRIKENRILQGRLRISDYYKSYNSQIQQSKNYVMEYNNLTKWIKKNVPYQNIKKGEFFVKEYTNDELIEMEKNGYIFTA